MTTDERLLAIEEERLAMEKKRDKNATLRFMTGSVLIAVATTGLSLYINDQQEKRALLASEQQWIIPMLLKQDPDDLDTRAKMIEEILTLNISDHMQNYLGAQQFNIAEARIERDKQIAAEQEALAEQKRQEELAEAARLKAEELEKQEKQEELKLAKEEQEKARQAAQAAKLRALQIEQRRLDDMLKRFNKDLLPF